MAGGDTYFGDCKWIILDLAVTYPTCGTNIRQGADTKTSPGPTAGGPNRDVDRQVVRPFVNCQGFCDLLIILELSIFVPVNPGI